MIDLGLLREDPERIVPLLQAKDGLRVKLTKL